MKIYFKKLASDFFLQKRTTFLGNNPNFEVAIEPISDHSSFGNNENNKTSENLIEECKEIKIEIDLYENTSGGFYPLTKSKQESSLKEEFPGEMNTKYTFLSIYYICIANIYNLHLAF